MNLKNIILLCILILAFTGMYFIGKKSAESDMQTKLTENYTLIKKIAELASVEVQGNSELDIKPNADGSYYNNLKNLFFENSVYLRVPYTAKYGVDLNNMEVKVEHEKKQVKIFLPHAQLLSYELKLDKISANNKRGWFVFEDDNTYLSIQEKLYTQSRATLAQNQNHIQTAQNNISQILTDYFKSFGMNAEVYFDNSITNNTKE